MEMLREKQLYNKFACANRDSFVVARALQLAGHDAFTRMTIGLYLVTGCNTEKFI